MSPSLTNQAKRPVWPRLAGMLTVLVCIASSVHADGIAVEEDQHGETAVTNDGRLLLKLRTQPSPMKLYVSQLFTPQGTQVLRDSPHDHVHHHALMYAIGIDGADFWSEVPAQDYGKQVPAGLPISLPPPPTGVARFRSNRR